MSKHMLATEILRGCNLQIKQHMDGWTILKLPCVRGSPALLITKVDLIFGEQFKLFSLSFAYMK